VDHRCSRSACGNSRHGGSNHHASCMLHCGSCDATHGGGRAKRGAERNGGANGVVAASIRDLNARTVGR
jgi:hypothetical protein